MNWLRYQVKDKDGHIEFEVYRTDTPGYVKVHYPKLEGHPKRGPLQTDVRTFKEMRMSDFGYMLFAYSTEEFDKFNEFLLKQLKEEAKKFPEYKKGVGSFYIA